MARSQLASRLFCMALSLTLGLVISVAVLGWSVSQATVLASGAHGLAVFLTWKRGARWFRKILGVRPLRPLNSDHPHDGLDLGN
jgi:hypothetical protein